MLARNLASSESRCSPKILFQLKENACKNSSSTERKCLSKVIIAQLKKMQDRKSESTETERKTSQNIKILACNWQKGLSIFCHYSQSWEVSADVSPIF